MRDQIVDVMAMHEMRCMFALMAPSEVPAWFDADYRKAENPHARPVPGSDQEVDARHYEWARMLEQNRYFAWRWAYADLMLAGMTTGASST